MGEIIHIRLVRMWYMQSGRGQASISQKHLGSDILKSIIAIWTTKMNSMTELAARAELCLLSDPTIKSDLVEEDEEDDK